MYSQVVKLSLLCPKLTETHPNSNQLYINEDPLWFACRAKMFVSNRFLYLLKLLRGHFLVKELVVSIITNCLNTTDQRGREDHMTIIMLSFVF